MINISVNVTAPIWPPMPFHRSKMILAYANVASILATMHFIQDIHPDVTILLDNDSSTMVSRPIHLFEVFQVVDVL